MNFFNYIYTQRSSNRKEKIKDGIKEDKEPVNI